VEIEAKVLLDDAERLRLVQVIERAGLTLSDPVVQRDVYFKERGFRQRVHGPGSCLVRVRYEFGRTTLNMKRLTQRDGVWEEVETPVGNGMVAESIIQSIGGEHAVTVTKSRRSARLDRLDILIDDVQDLGSFLEVAVETDEDGVAAAREEIDDFLKHLSISKDRIELRGYPMIILETQGVAFY